MEANCISYKETGFFSQTVTDYLANAATLQPFYACRPTIEGFTELLARKKITADRQTLVATLKKQYEQVAAVSPQSINALHIERLLDSNTYTVTTGHQLNIFAGPLYFIYKIVTAIKLSQQLKEAFPGKDFVPVYWMATEDHDFAEINYTNIGGVKVQWQLNASGATGRLLTKSIRQALNQYKGVLGMEGYAQQLADIVETAYTGFNKLADATRYLVNALFGQYGLIIIDADDHELKKQFAPIITQDIIQRNSFKHINATDARLKAAGVDTQIHSREINFFYLTDTLRERIVFEDGRYKVLNTKISFSEQELKREVSQFPERFSPNVALRPLYQELILPNVAYIGGGAEMVYWLQLKGNFDHYNIDFPVLILRNSGLIIPREQSGKINRMQLRPQDFFRPTDELKKQWIETHSKHNLTLKEEWRELEAIFEKIRLRAYKIDSTLVPSTNAVQTRLKHAIDNLEKKLTRAEKRNYATQISHIDQVKTTLFPNGSLQERYDNFGLYYVKWGQAFIDELIRNFEPLDFEFCILTE